MADELLVALKAGEAWPVNGDGWWTLHDQCMSVGQRRVEMNLRIAALGGPPR